jgi:hypothetical protein
MKLPRNCTIASRKPAIKSAIEWKLLVHIYAATDNWREWNDVRDVGEALRSGPLEKDRAGFLLSNRGRWWSSG